MKENSRVFIQTQTQIQIQVTDGRFQKGLFKFNRLKLLKSDTLTLNVWIQKLVKSIENEYTLI